MRISLCVMLLILAGICLTGCFAAKARNIESFVKPYQTDVTMLNYYLEPPDEIEIQCAKVPEIHLQRQTIRPDGKISFAGLGEFRAAGKTPLQLRQIIREKAEKLYTLPGKDPIDVRLTVSLSKVYYVVGEVSSPGPRRYTGRNTVLRALAEAHPVVTAWTDQIQVIRPSADPDQAKVFRIKYNDMIVHGDLSKNVLLEEGDIIYVPPTILAGIAMVIEEFARPIGRALSPYMMIERVSTGTPTY